MKTFEELPYHPTVERLVDYICTKTGNSDRTYFRVIISAYITQAASTMWTKVRTMDRGDIPVNLYAICVAPSGYGKGHSTYLMEEDVMSGFREKFLEETFPALAEINLIKISNRRAIQKGTDSEYELEKARKEFEQQGELLFSFDSGTSAALKQMRSKLLYANAGSCNFIMDELGSNLEGNTELLNSFLELYDKGRIKQKLVKNTSENQRYEDLRGATPTNMLLFGTQSKLLDGGKTELAYMTFLETGYARRCFFAVGEPNKQQANTLTPEQIIEQIEDDKTLEFIQRLHGELTHLADRNNFGKTLPMTREANLEAIRYRLHCEGLANQLPEHSVIHIPEVSHRFFKTLKLAGAFAFLEGSPEVTLLHWEYAVKQAEESSKAFTKMMNREKPYVRLAKYITTISEEVTQADLVEELPFYRGTAAQKNDMLALASAWSYKNNRVIKKNYVEGVELYSGSYLEETDLQKLILSYSTDANTGFSDEYAPFDKLHHLSQLPNGYWSNHHYVGTVRNTLHLIEGFNMVAIDVEMPWTEAQIKLLMRDYTYHMAVGSGIRLMFPLSHKLKLNAEEYKEFISSLYEWLPFNPVDSSSTSIALAWTTEAGHYSSNEGEMLSVFPFIPKTTKKKEYQTTLKELDSFQGIERWFAHRMIEGNRKAEITTYGNVLRLGGTPLLEASNTLKTFNSKLSNALSDEEMEQTILSSLAKERFK